MEDLDSRPHVIKMNAVWNSPDVQSAGAVARHLLRDWQVSAIWTGTSGAAYDLGYSYTSDGGAVNITGSPNWGGRMILLNGLGSGCSDNQYAQFNALAAKGPGYNSVSMESGRNTMRGCFIKTLDMSVIRRIRIPGIGEDKRIELRADVYNALDTVNWTSRSTSANYNNPTSMTLNNNQFNADGTLNSARLTPRNAGFGAANGANAMRNIQLQLRFQF
jgi:hypothetical protein